MRFTKRSASCAGLLASPRAAQAGHEGRDPPGAEQQAQAYAQSATVEIMAAFCSGLKLASPRPVLVASTL